jgi:transcriptional regulator with XRE-family HTH domain
MIIDQEKTNLRKEDFKLELGSQIKKYRADINLSQEDLAEKIYVTRQTISNWETRKSYPDIHSLLLLSSLYNVSLDQLIKGDIETMKEEIKEVEQNKLNHYGNIFTILFISMIISFVPLFHFLKIIGIIIWSILSIITLIFAFKLERIKKDNNIHTYKEIVAFTEGKRLDEIQKQVEVGKRPYQDILLMIGSGCITLLVCILLFWLFWLFR